MERVSGKKITRRTYMIYKLFIGGRTISECSEAVNQAIAGHPEWDMEEKKTWKEWEGGRATDTATTQGRPGTVPGVQ